MSEGRITHAETDGKGRYVYREDGHEAELTYARLGEDKVIANHTGVPDALSGTGVGLKLVERLVADARAQGFRIVPQCPFVEAMRKRNPDWADAFTT